MVFFEGRKNQAFFSCLLSYASFTVLSYTKSILKKGTKRSARFAIYYDCCNEFDAQPYICGYVSLSSVQ